MASLQDYYKQVETRQIEQAEPQSPKSGMYAEKTEGMNPVARMMHLGEESRRLEEEVSAMSALGKAAAAGITGAFDKIRERHQGDPSVFTVKLDANMVDDQGHLSINGQSHEQFGARRIDNDVQMASLERDVDRVRKYFPEAQLHDVETRDGRVAIVTGTNAKDFNAAVAFENEIKALQLQQQALAEEQLKLNKQMGLHNTRSAISGGNETQAQTFAHSPAAEVDKSQLLTPT